MPSDLCYWLISAPLKDGSPDIMLNEVRQEIPSGVFAAKWEIPELKVRRITTTREDWMY